MSTIIKSKGKRTTYSHLDSQGLYDAIRLGQFCLCGSKVSLQVSADYGKRNGEVQLRRYCGLVLLRIGHLPSKEEVEYVMRKVCALPHTHLAWREADGRSVCLVGQAEWGKKDQPTTVEQMQQYHSSAYMVLHYIYSSQLMISIDTCKPLLEDEVPYSYDPDAFYRADSLPVMVGPDAMRIYSPEIAPPTPAFPCLPGMSSIDSMSYVYHSCRHRALEESRLRCNDEEERSEKMMVLLADYCHKAGLPKQYAMGRSSWLDGWSKRMPLLERIFLNAYEKELNAMIPFGSISKSALLTLQTEGFLAQHYELRKNVLTGVVQYRERNGYEFDFSDFTEEAMNSMTNKALKAGLGSWDKDVRRLVNSKDIHRYDPLEDYLSDLPAWDGKDRVEALAARIPTDTPRFSYYLHVWLLSMVAHWQGRDRLHGNAIVPLLIGEQGCGKSTFASLILPPQLRDYYNDKVDFRSESDIMSGLTRFALINIDEFDSLKKSQQPTLKYLLSKSEVKVRPAYGKIIEHRRRYASFIATTNLVRPLVDRTGSRRFVCVQVTSGERIDTFTPIDYPQLYAQLLAEIQEGRRYWLDDAETLEIQQHNARFQKLTDLTDIVDELLCPPCHSAEEATVDEPHPAHSVCAYDSGAAWMTLDELMHYMQSFYPYISITPSMHKTLGTILREKKFPVRKTKACNKYLVQKRLQA